MAGDYTRFSFKKEKRYSDLRQQQGRVALDSDWNEGFEIVRHRARLQALDTFGPFGVSALTNPDAFKIGFIAGAPPNLSIHPGRIYVDGILVEAFDAEAATYLHQPFYPAPVPALPASGDALVYLDVWEREITAIQDPTLLDAALGGVDTTTRMQTVWQVKVTPHAGAVCGLAVGDLPSAGRLTTEAVNVPAPADPCILPEATGYRGLENQLYRIEVQKAGPMGTATALWSRDNASIVSAVRDMTTSGTHTTLTVDRIGRDQFLRFEVGDLVTVTDDYRELMGEAGDLALVSNIDEFNNEIELAITLPVAGSRAFGANAADLKARHTRVQRWDGTIAIPATNAPVTIELGIQVRFSASPAGGSFRVGDYWAFWARTATAEIEILTAAPPRGITHHYKQLAAITGLPNPTKITDCRPKELCCCTIVVAVGDDIQQAINSLPKAGGCICLKTGEHIITATLTLAHKNVRFHGESPGAIIKIASATTVLAISDTSDIAIEGIEFQSTGAALGVIRAKNVVDAAIVDCKVTGGDTTGSPSIGIELSGCSRLRVMQTTIGGVATGIHAGGAGSASLVFERNTIGRNSEKGHVSGTQVTTGILVQTVAGPCRIEENAISGMMEGIVINDNPSANVPPASDARGTIVSRNMIACPIRNNEKDSDPPLVAIDVASDESIVSMNLISTMGGAAHIGIRATGAGVQVVDNQLAWASDATGAAKTPPGRIGIEIGYYANNAAAPTVDARVRGNLIAGYAAGIVVAVALDTMVCENTIMLDVGAENAPSGVGILTYLCLALLIEDNLIVNAGLAVSCIGGMENRISSNTMNNATQGITLALEIGSAVDRNRIASVTERGITEIMVSGRCDVIENRLTDCGTVGIFGFLVVGELHIESNEIVDTGPEASQTVSAPPPPPVAGAPAAPAPSPPPPPVYGIFGLGVLEARIESNLITTSNILRRPAAAEDRAVWMMGLIDYLLIHDGTTFRFQEGELASAVIRGTEKLPIQKPDPAYQVAVGFAIQIVDNKFEGSGNSALVELFQLELLNGISDGDDRVHVSLYTRFARVICCGNYCLHLASSDAINPAEIAPKATVRLCGRAASVANNHVKAVALDKQSGQVRDFPGYHSFDFGPGVAPKGNMPGPFMGNVISGSVTNHPVFPTPQASYNLTM
jgi:nitrous oxidase accessory protein NosD